MKNSVADPGFPGRERAPTLSLEQISIISLLENKIN